MQIKFLGQAGFLLESKNCKILCDPWFSSTGGFLARWHQFPPNEHINQKLLKEADYLYISHEHHDHFDRTYLESFPKDIPLLIANYQTKDFRDELSDIGFSNITEINDWETKKLSDDFEIMLLTDPGKYKEDSSLMIKSDGHIIFNKNDCYLSKNYLEKLSEFKIDILFTQFSGAIWYPMVYDYDEQKKKDVAKTVRNRLNDNFLETVNLLKPKFVIPSAGPPCFLEDDCFNYNFLENGIFPDQNNIVSEIEGKIFSKYNMMQPNDDVFLNNNEIKFENYYEFDFENKEELLKKYKNTRLPIIQNYLKQISQPKNDLFEKFCDFFQDIFNFSSYFTSSVQQIVEFNILGDHGGIWQIDFTKNPPQIHNGKVGLAQYRFDIDSKYMNLILNEQINFEDFLLSLRLKISRNPDTYNGPLFTLLQYGRSPLLIQRAENFELRSKSPTTINVQEKNKIYKIQRFCPHLGEDLKNGTITDGVLVCPRHQWNFDLNSCGKCIAGGNKDLSVYQTVDLDEAENTGMA